MTAPPLKSMDPDRALRRDSAGIERPSLKPRNDACVDPRAQPEVLYIMGAGRSGTTILEVLLANNPGFVGVGEVHRIFRHGFIEDRTCACGKRARQCDLWANVLHSSGWREEDLPAIAEQFERLESHSRFPLVWAGLNVRQLASYRSVNERLFRQVGATQQSKIVVDSSKYASRALLLARSFPDRVRVLCITRSAAGLLSAFRKKNDGEQRPKGSVAAAAYYLYVLLCMHLVRARLKSRCLAIRFEDLNREPHAVLERIESWSGHSLAEAKARIANGGLFDVGHIVTGNRLRKKGRVKFEPTRDEEGKAPGGFGMALLARTLEGYRKLLGF